MGARPVPSLSASPREPSLSASPREEGPPVVPDRLSVRGNEGGEDCIPRHVPGGLYSCRLAQGRLAESHRNCPCLSVKAGSRTASTSFSERRCGHGGARARKSATGEGPGAHAWSACVASWSRPEALLDTPADPPSSHAPGRPGSPDGQTEGGPISAWFWGGFSPQGPSEHLRRQPQRGLPSCVISCDLEPSPLRGMGRSVPRPARLGSSGKFEVHHSPGLSLQRPLPVSEQIQKPRALFFPLQLEVVQVLRLILQVQIALLLPLLLPLPLQVGWGPCAWTGAPRWHPWLRPLPALSSLQEPQPVPLLPQPLPLPLALTLQVLLPRKETSVTVPEPHPAVRFLS